jgi:hypothetical protein
MKAHESGASTFELVCYLIASARLTLDEAPRYGSQRLLVAASRLIAGHLEQPSDKRDAKLVEWKEGIDDNLFKMALDYPAFVSWLSDLTREVGRSAAERNLAEPDTP